MGSIFSPPKPPKPPAPQPSQQALDEKEAEAQRLRSGRGVASTKLSADSLASQFAGKATFGA